MKFEPMQIQFLDLVHKPNQYNIIELFPDSSFESAETCIVKERRQTVDGRTFVVNSIFERGAPQTAADRLRSLVELEAEKDGRNAV